MVINVKNPVYSIIFLILVFINIAGLLIYLGVEFLGMVFLVVYIGAIAVLFLFVVMMINIRYVELTSKELYYLPINGFFLMVPLSLELGFYFYFNSGADLDIVTYQGYASGISVLGNAHLLGILLYSAKYSPIVIFSALILLVAMVGAIVLTLTKRFDVRRQDPFDQIIRDYKKATQMYTIESK